MRNEKEKKTERTGVFRVLKIRDFSLTFAPLLFLLSQKSSSQVRVVVLCCWCPSPSSRKKRERDEDEEEERGIWASAETKEYLTVTAKNTIRKSEKRARKNISGIENSFKKLRPFYKF